MSTKCNKCNSDMQVLDYGEDFKYLVCKNEDCKMTLTVQVQGEDVWEDRSDK